jgi:hypothetical protein
MTNAVSIAQLGSSNGTMRNRIINGAMVIDQRNAGASVTPTVDGTYTIDRWKARLTQASKYSIQQNAGSVTPPVGFNYYLGVTSLSSYSVGSTDFFLVQQPIEGYNVADLQWGTANAKTVTLSFWVRSSLTGSFSGTIQPINGTRNYPYTYTISSANTWEQKSITIPGDTSGTWGSTNSEGISVFFNLGVGSSYSGTANAWTSSAYIGVTGSTTPVVGTNGATWYITGVQFEVGTTATNFEYRPYGMELALSQRYFWRKNGVVGSIATIGSGMVYNTTDVRATLVNPVPMRAQPTVSFTGTNFEYEKTAASRGSLSTLDAAYRSPEAVMVYSGSGTTSTTAGQGAIMYITDAASYISINAEM